MKILLILAFLIPVTLFAESAPPLPTNSQSWLDGKPVSWESLKGKVVLLNVWTQACWNSYRSLSWIVSLQKKYPDLQVIGIHSPEFESEKDTQKLRATMRQYHISYAQVLDNDHDYWNKLHNQYWPAFYVVDKDGAVRGKFAGETHPDDEQAKEVEQLIGKLTQETPKPEAR
jgi:glutathione peroxidase-family protein